LLALKPLQVTSDRDDWHRYVVSQADARARIKDRLSTHGVGESVDGRSQTHLVVWQRERPIDHRSVDREAARLYKESTKQLTDASSYRGSNHLSETVRA
jgi:hypothetical protein